jgi:pantetheine-phosphate adenylyltransferase
MNKTAIYPGTFDPITNGHIDLIVRTLKIFKEVIIAVAPSTKKQTLFTTDERIKLINKSVKRLKGTRAEAFNTLLVDYAKKRKSVAIIRGLRAVSIRVTNGPYEQEAECGYRDRFYDAER